MISGRPVLSTNTSTPAGPTIPRIRSRAFSRFAFTRCVAPIVFASASRPSYRSTAMIGLAVTSAAACTMLSPTPPAPNTTTDSPMRTLALFCTTPKPVVTAQPKSAATSASTSAGMVVSRFSETTAYSLKVVTQPALTLRPFQVYAGVAESMPRPLRQCSTTMSPGETCRTPGPISRTSPEPSCPRRCGRNLSSPLAPSISPSCEPQMPLQRTRTSTCPGSSRSGKLISPMTSGWRRSVRIAARVVFGRAIALFEINERVVAAVPGLLEPPGPLRGRIERLARHLPVEQVRFLGLVAIGLHAKVFALGDALHLPQRLVQVVAVQVMQRLDGDREIEVAIGPRQGCRIADAQPVLELILGVADGVLGDVDAVDLHAWHHQREVIKQVALAAADIEDALTRLDAVMLGHRARDFLPAARHVAVAAVIDAAVAVPIVIVPFLRQLGGLRLGKFGIVDARQVVAPGRLVQWRHEVEIGHGYILQVPFGEELACLCELPHPALRGQGVARGKGTASDDLGEKFIQRDAGPTGAEYSREQPHAPHDRGSIVECGEGDFQEKLEMLARRANPGVQEEVARHLRRIVPARVLEVEEAELAVRPDQRVVEAEV